jgi:hypothetical protein
MLLLLVLLLLFACGHICRTIMIIDDHHGGGRGRGRCCCHFTRIIVLIVSFHATRVISHVEPKSRIVYEYEQAWYDVKQNGQHNVIKDDVDVNGSKTSVGVATMRLGIWLSLVMVLIG